MRATATSSDVVVDWSRIAFEAAMTDDGFVSFLGARHQAMMHIAMHDALNAIRPRYEQYAYAGRSYGADPVAAAAAAAIVALRQDDGTDVDLLSPNYTPGTEPGDYQFVPPYTFTFAEDFRYATPFGLTSPEQFRVPPPRR